jgi:hypothetical protein
MCQGLLNNFCVSFTITKAWGGGIFMLTYFFSTYVYELYNLRRYLQCIQKKASSEPPKNYTIFGIF